MIRYLSILFLLLSSVILYSQDNNLYESESDIRIDWLTNKLYLEFQFNTDQNSRLQTQPDGYTRSREIASTLLPNYIGSAFSRIPIDSQITFLDIFQTNPDALFFYKDIQWETITVNYSKETELYTATFMTDLYPHIIQPLVTQTKTKKLPIAPNTHLSDSTTGIIIYVPNELPVRGSLEKASFEPAIFSRVLDQNLDPIISREFIEPEVILKQGAMPYSTPTATKHLREIVGETPLIILAQELWGIYKSDIIISQKDSWRILGQEKYRNFIKEGRFIITSYLEPLPTDN